MPKIITLLSLSALLLLASCGRPSEPPDLGLAGVQEGDPDRRLIKAGLGKEDFALIEAELRCVAQALTGDAADTARAAIIEKWITTEEWVQGVRAHLVAETEFAAKIEGALKEHLGKVCPGGVPTEAFLAELDAVVLPARAAPKAVAAPPESAPTPTPAPE